MLKRFLCAAAVVPLLIGVAAASAQTAAPTAADPVLARVNGDEIKRSDVDTLIAQLPPNVREMPPEVVYPALIDQIINQKLISAAGYKAKLQDTQGVKDELKHAEERAVQRAFIRQQLDAKITPAMLENAYKQRLATNPPQEEVKASHILVEKEDDAKAIIAELKKGGDFAKIAREKSKDTAAAAQGGDLGYFTREAMVEAFSNAAFAMKPGDISETPVKTQFGWHVIKVVDKRTPAPPPMAEVKPELEKAMTQEIVAKVVEDLRAAAKIDILTPPPAPAPAPAPAKD